MRRRLLRIVASDAALVVAALVVLAATFAVLFYSTSSRVTRLERPSEAEILRRETIGLQACSTGEPLHRTKVTVRAARACRAALLEALARGVGELTPAQRRRLRRESVRRARRRRHSSAGASGARARTRRPTLARRPAPAHRAPRPATHHRRPSSPSSPAPSPGPPPSSNPPPPSPPPPIVTVPTPAVCLDPIVHVGSCPSLTLVPPVPTL